ncbi:MAG: YfhO family protein, partial [Clostridia bacterium]|nr:YfhO family protein [Clostridia bacterium]
MRTRGSRSYFLYAFLLGLGLAAVIFLPFLIVDGGRFLFYGDYNVQQIPFYRIAHDAVRSGNLGWNHLTDLGVNFIGSYSFYLLGSPFFWLTIPFPGEWLQYLMGPLFILKFGCAALTGYVYLHRYAKNPNTALIGSLLYAFSGFSIYNIFFNHFHEAIIVFPLLLAALDEYMATRRRGIFAMMVALCCITNYYFFVGMVTFTAIYFFVRLFSGSWKISVKDFLLLALEAVLGLGLACVLLVPSVLCILQNYRVSNPISGWDALLYGNNQRYIHILQSLFFLPDLPARPNFTPDSNSKWSSLGAWLPMFGMTGVIGWLQIHRKHWLKRMLCILFIMALIPGLNAAFQLMNASYYARWFYMLTLMMSAATMMSIENPRVDWKRALKWTTLITVVMGLVIGLMPTLIEEDGEVVSVTYGLEKYSTRLWCYVAIALICLALVGFLVTFYVRNSKAFYRAATICLSIVIVLTSIYWIALGKTQSADPNSHIIPYALNGGEDVQIDDLRDDRVRTDFYESLDNSAMFWQVQSIQAFHSIVPGSLMEFYESIGVQRD